MRITRRVLYVLLVAVLVLLGMMPSSLAEEQVKGPYGLGLLPATGDFPRLDTSRLQRDLASLPSVVDLSAGLPPVGNQGMQSSCVAWAVGYYYKTFQERQERGWEVNTTAHQFSPAYIYNQRATSDCTKDAGMTFPNGFTILQTKGAATLAAFPYSQLDSCTQPSQAVVEGAWPYRSESYANVFLGKGNADLAVLKALLANGEPIALAVPVYADFYGASSTDYIVTRPAPGEPYYGGHAVLVVGYDDAIGGFKIVNSWGTAWGKSGFAYLTYDFVRYDCFEAWVMTDHVETPETPTPATFQGTVTRGGQNVAQGTAVRAWIGETQVGATTVTLQNGVAWYQLQIPADDPNTPALEGGKNGDLVRFQVGEEWAQESGTWQSGNTTTLNLTLPAAEPHFDAATLWIACYGKSSGGWSSQDTYPRAVADVNGDGKADVVGFGKAGVYVSLANGSRFNTPSLWVGAFGYSAGGWTSQNLYPRMLADVNGDGRADVVGFYSTATYVALSTGKGFSAQAVWIKGYGTSAGGWSSQDKYPRAVADVNGDGKADIVGFGNAGAYVSLSTGKSFGAASLWIKHFGYSAGGWTSQNLYPRFVADVNGDGKADIVGCNTSGVWVSRSTGTGFAAPSLWLADFGTAAGWSSYDRYPRALADVNGDGKADVIGFRDQGVLVALSTGTSFAAPTLWSREFGYAGGWTSQNTYPRAVADVNGDRRADVVGFAASGTFVALASSPAPASAAPVGEAVAELAVEDEARDDVVIVEGPLADEMVPTEAAAAETLALEGE